MNGMVSEPVFYCDSFLRHLSLHISSTSCCKFSHCAFANIYLCILWIQISLPQRDNEMSRKLTKIFQKCRESDLSYYQLCHLVRQGEQPREGYFLLSNLVEDQARGASGYADWFMQLHRQVQQNA